MGHRAIQDRLQLDARGVTKTVRSSTLKLGGTNPAGDELAFTNYYMTWNGEPYFGITGEFHFSRYSSDGWEEGLLKMKAAGINIVATYIFWIHHEEDKGDVRWDGNLALRRFIELCGKHGLHLILRVGPFCHGECRNGGLPDWLYGTTFEARSNDPQYLSLVSRWYSEIGKQAEGLMFKDGGPVIGVQLENEYMHAGAPWEMTTGSTNEFVPAGQDGASHMAELKKLAIEAGLVAPIYTSTGWGGAAVLEDEVLPLYGGYAYTPWNVNKDRPNQPPTTEYLFQDYHRNGALAYGYEPPYEPDKYPFACCEMGGGMQAWYEARFQVEPQSVEAMTLQKIAGGCNFVGYYVFHGGTQPVGEHAYLNERTCPKLSYDYQAPIGEFGQVRESYHRLKRIFMFLRSFGHRLARTATVLPANAEELKPEDTRHVRYAARIHQGSGFLFLNNYQDHVATEDHEGLSFTIKLDHGDIRLPAAGGNLDLKSGVSCMLPIRKDLDGVLLEYATAQPLTCMKDEGRSDYFFFAPEGMQAEFAFQGIAASQLEITGGTIEECGKLCIARFAAEDSQGKLAIRHEGATITVHLLTHEQSLRLWDMELWGERRLILSEHPLIEEEGGIRLLRQGGGKLSLAIYPDPSKAELQSDIGPFRLAGMEAGLFARYEAELPDTAMQPELKLAGTRKAAVSLPEEMWQTTQAKQWLLAVDYVGDVGNAFIGGKLAADHFYNGDAWEIELMRHQEQLRHNPLDIVIVPARTGQLVTVDSAMAVQHAFVGSEAAEIGGIQLIPTYSVKVTA